MYHVCSVRMYVYYMCVMYVLCTWCSVCTGFNVLYVKNMYYFHLCVPIPTPD